MEGRRGTELKTTRRTRRAVCWRSPLPPSHRLAEQGFDRIGARFAGATQDFGVIPIDHQGRHRVSVELDQRVLVGVEVRVKDHEVLEVGVLEKSANSFSQALTGPAPGGGHLQTDGLSEFSPFLKPSAVERLDQNGEN